MDDMMVVVVVATTQNCGLLLGFTQYFSSARQATAAPGSPGDLLRVAFSGLCVVLYANWIKNETHFFFFVISTIYLSSCVRQIRRIAKQFLVALARLLYY